MLNNKPVLIIIISDLEVTFFSLYRLTERRFCANTAKKIEIFPFFTVSSAGNDNFLHVVGHEKVITQTDAFSLPS